MSARKSSLGRVLAYVATARPAPDFEDLGRSLRDLSRPELSAAVEELVRRRLIVADSIPHPHRPLFDPPIVRYRAVALKGGVNHA